MEHDEPDSGGDAATAHPIERDDGAGPVPVGWLLIGVGVVGYLVIQILQMRRYDFQQPWTDVLLTAGFLIASALATAGIVVIALQRWVLPELVARLGPPATPAGRPVDQADSNTATVDR